MQERDDMQARIAGLLLDRLHLEVPSVDTDLIDTGALDSMMFVELLARLETEFGITIGLEEIDLDAFRSIRAIAEFVLSRTRAPQSCSHGG
jgi:acyl carrier protein